jgi:hypothetical protein
MEGTQRPRVVCLTCVLVSGLYCTASEARAPDFFRKIRRWSLWALLLAAGTSARLTRRVLSALEVHTTTEARVGSDMMLMSRIMFFHPGTVQTYLPVLLVCLLVVP